LIVKEERNLYSTAQGQSQWLQKLKQAKHTEDI